jgi:hypothetical protein
MMITDILMSFLSIFSIYIWCIFNNNSILHFQFFRIDFLFMLHFIEVSLVKFIESFSYTRGKFIIVPCTLKVIIAITESDNISILKYRTRWTTWEGYTFLVTAAHWFFI